jgi:hypothetical protein
MSTRPRRVHQSLDMPRALPELLSVRDAPCVAMIGDASPPDW